MSCLLWISFEKRPSRITRCTALYGIRHGIQVVVHIILPELRAHLHKSSSPLSAALYDSHTKTSTREKIPIDFPPLSALIYPIAILYSPTRSPHDQTSMRRALLPRLQRKMGFDLASMRNIAVQRIARANTTILMMQERPREWGDGAHEEQMDRVISVEAIWRPKLLADRLEGLSGTRPRLEQSFCWREGRVGWAKPHT